MESVFYLGACSPQGFASHYDSLLREHLQLNIIKGGSGCGKSTFMRRIGRAAQERGLDVSYILCSSDPDSLDGVVIPALETAFVDGTAPHVLEPSLCGGSMNYVNFGAFYDRAAMRQSEDEIRAAQALNAAQYPHVTACLSAADKLLDSVRAVTATRASTEQTTSLAECLALSVLRPTGESPRTATRFLSAVTPKGLRFCVQTPPALCARVYVLRDNYFLAPRLLARLLERPALQCAEILPAKGDAPVRRLDEADDGLHRRGFAAAALADDAQHLARVQLKAHIVARAHDLPHLAGKRGSAHGVVFFEVLDLEYRFAHAF